MYHIHFLIQQSIRMHSATEKLLPVCHNMEQRSCRLIRLQWDRHPAVVSHVSCPALISFPVTKRALPLRDMPALNIICSYDSTDFVYVAAVNWAFFRIPHEVNSVCVKLVCRSGGPTGFTAPEKRSEGSVWVWCNVTQILAARVGYSGGSGFKSRSADRRF
jgi:hypothetical protein